MSALSWWYRLSAPAAGSASVSVAQSAASRERVRRGQLASLILLVVILLQIVSLAIVLVSHDYRSLPLVALSLVVCGLAIILNRIGMATIAGVLVIAVIDLGCGLLLLTTPNGLGVRDLPAFDVLVESELVAVSLLPAVSVFYVAAAISAALLTTWDHTRRGGARWLFPSNGSRVRIPSPAPRANGVAPLAFFVRSVEYG